MKAFEKMNIENLSSHSHFHHVFFKNQTFQGLLNICQISKATGVDGDLKCKNSVAMSMVPKGPIGLTYRLSLLFGGYDGGLGMVVCTSTRVMVTMNM